jgi:hypothetical protein
MQAGFCGRLETAQGGVYVVLFRAGERRYGAMLDFGGHGSRGFEVPGRGDREAGFDDVNAELLDLPRELKLFLAMHRKARRLLAVSQSGVKNLDGFHGDSFLYCQ